MTEEQRKVMRKRRRINNRVLLASSTALGLAFAAPKPDRNPSHE